MQNLRSLAELGDAIGRWQERLSRLVPPQALGDRASPGAVEKALSNLERRLREGPDAPVRVALFGPTGAGKSKIFNSLIGEPLSPSSYRRPCTRQPMYYLHERHGTIARSLSGQVQFHQRQEFDRVILIDTPDFDSVESENRALAAQVYHEVDAFILVTDVHKYGDASVWSYLDQIHSEGKRCVFVLNKVQEGSNSGEGAQDDFRRRLLVLFQGQDLPGPVLSIADSPRGDESLLPEEEPGLTALRTELAEVALSGSGGGSVLLARSFRTDLLRLLLAWDRLFELLSGYRMGLDRLRQDLESRFDVGADAIPGEMAAEIDSGLKGEVYRQVLRRIERLDLLRYPRRLLALPVVGLRRALGRFWPGRGDPSPGGSPRESALEVANLARLEEKIVDLTDETEKAMRAETACPGLLDGQDGESFRLDHSEIRGRYVTACEGFRSWVEEKANTTAANLATEHKVKFILSQVIYNSVVIGVQIKTAGALTLTEIATDGVLSPLVAKAVGMAVSSERVKEFEEEARLEHGRRMVEILREVETRAARWLSRHAEGRDVLDLLAPEVERLRPVVDRLVERFPEWKGTMTGGNE